jgi:hypothetical protein
MYPKYVEVSKHGPNPTTTQRQTSAIQLSPNKFTQLFRENSEENSKWRLLEELARRRSLPAHQAGFRPHKSSMYHAVRLERQAQSAIGRRRQAAVMFCLHQRCI